jgi:hypothetical protein
MVVKFDTKDASGWTHVRMRKDEDGSVMVEIPKNATVFRSDKIPAKMVDKKTFLKVSYNDPEDNGKVKTGWVDESVLFPQTPEVTSVKPPVKSPDLPVLPENLDPNRDPWFKMTFDRVAREVENTPTGSIFSINFNKVLVPFRVTKQNNNYILTGDGGALNFTKSFGSVRAIQDYFESKTFNQEVTIMLLQNRQYYKDNYENSRSREGIGELKDNPAFTAPNHISFELKWNGDPSPKVFADIQKDGTIFYRIERQNITAGGDNFLQGTAADIDEFMSKLAFIKGWGDVGSLKAQNESGRGYRSQHESQAAIARNAQEENERIQYGLTMFATEKVNYLDRQAQIGRTFGFEANMSSERATFFLSWDGTEQPFKTSKQNPIVSIHVTPQNTLEYSVINASGPMEYSKDQKPKENTMMGTTGEVATFQDLLNKLAEIKQDRSVLKDIRTLSPQVIGNPQIFPPNWNPNKVPNDRRESPTAVATANLAPTPSSTEKTPTATAANVTPAPSLSPSNTGGIPPVRGVPTIGKQQTSQ